MVNKNIYNTALELVHDTDREIIKKLSDVLDGKDMVDAVRNLANLLSICLEQSVQDRVWTSEEANISIIEILGELRSLADSLTITAIQQKINDIAKSN